MATSLEAQVTAVHNAVVSTDVPRARRALMDAEETLKALIKMRNAIVESVVGKVPLNGGADADDVCDAVSDELLAVLMIPGGR